MPCAFMSLYLDMNNNGVFKREHVESCPSVTKKSYLHDGYGYLTWQSGDLPSGVL